MLKLLNGESATVLNVDDFYIKQVSSGLDELIFNISIYDPSYPQIVEEAVIEYEQPYLIKAIDAGSDSAKIKCQINLDALKTEMYVGYSNSSNTLSGTVNGVLPSGWVFIDNSSSTILRTIEGNYTAYDIIFACMETYDVVMRFDVARKRINAYSLSDFKPLGAFATRQLNLTEINFKGKSTSFATRLYAYGKDGLSFADINGGVPYVDNQNYADKIICAYWQDDRYTNAANLLEAAKRYVAELAVPERSYECSVYDLAQTNPDLYSFQDFSLFSVVKLVDDVKMISIDYQVMEYQMYPYYPEQNVVTLSGTAPKIQNTVSDLQYEIENPNSGFRQIMQNAIENATGWITRGGGYMIMVQDENGNLTEIASLDTPSKENAMNVWRWNNGGFGHSSNGWNGPYTTAITQDGAIVANLITVGTMHLNRLSGGLLTLGGFGNSDGYVIINNENDQVAVILNSLYSQFNGENSNMIRVQNGLVRFLQYAVQVGYIGPAVDSTTQLDGVNLDASGYFLSLSADSTLRVMINKGLNPEGFTENIILNGTVRFWNYAYFGPGNARILAADNGYISVSPGLYVSGNLQCTGTKNRIVETKTYGKRLQYAYETTSPFFGDIGCGKIDESGQCYVAIDDIFRESISGGKYHVFLQAEGPGSVYVSEKKADFFVVSGTPGLSFSWEIKARQKGYEVERMEAQDIAADYKKIDYEAAYMYDIGRLAKEKEEIYNECLNELHVHQCGGGY